MSQIGHRASVDRSPESGIALLLVLWVLALIAALAIAFASSTHSDLQIVRNQYETARARTEADAAVSLALMGMLDPSPRTQWHANGETHMLALPNANVRVSVEDEGGKVDLNAAPSYLLLGLFQALGIDAGTSDDLVAAIIQRRQTQGAAPASSTPGLELAFSRPKITFIDVSDLRLLPGMTRSLYDRIAPYVTVYSRSPRINPLTAPAPVLAGVPGLTKAEIQDFIAARGQPSPNGNAMAQLHGGARFLSAQPPQVVTIRADAMTEHGARFVRKAIVALSAPYHFLAWEQAPISGIAAPASDE